MQTHSGTNARSTQFEDSVRRYFPEKLDVVGISGRSRVMAWVATVIWLLVVGGLSVLMAIEARTGTAYFATVFFSVGPPLIWHAVLQARASGKMMRRWAHARGFSHARKAGALEIHQELGSTEWLSEGDTQRFHHVVRGVVDGTLVIAAHMRSRTANGSSHSPMLVIGAACDDGTEGVYIQLRGLGVKVERALRYGPAADGIEWSLGDPQFDDTFLVTHEPGTSDGIVRQLVATLRAPLLAGQHFNLEFTKGAVVLRRPSRSEVDPSLLDEAISIALTAAQASTDT